jgi:4-nitrophenyl phosphatase
MSAKNIRALLLDMDGVLWRDMEAIGDLPSILAQITAKGFKLAFVTNNATRTVEQYQEKFRGFKVEAAAEQIFTSSKATGEYLQKRFPQGGNVYLIGERGLQEAMQEAGFTIANNECLAVVVGLDRELTYEKLKRAALLILRGSAFIGANPDPSLPSPEGDVPGAGSILAALQAATGIKPLIIGKPERALLDSAMVQLGVSPSETLVVGDRVETDIAAGQKAGCRTALLLSGVTSESAARAWQPAPDYIEKDLATLISKL